MKFYKVNVKRIGSHYDYSPLDVDEILSISYTKDFTEAYVSYNGEVESNEVVELTEEDFNASVNALMDDAKSEIISTTEQLQEQIDTLALEILRIKGLA